MISLHKTGKPCLAALLLVSLLAASCGFHHKKYENPISKDTQQPDKVLFDKSIGDIEKGRYELARLTLNTLINTYDSSEYLAKAKLAIADSWYREGGIAGLTQAEAEYKDFILFYPTMEEAAESQKRICDIHFKQMDKSDRDPNQGLRAEQECRQVIVQFPNSKFVPAAEQQLREIQESLAAGEFNTGHFYLQKGARAAAANRLGALVDQYPLYSKADLALWEAAEAYQRIGPRVKQKEGEELARLVKEYPLSPYVALAKQRLKELEMPIPDADPAAVARMKYEAENRTKPGIMERSVGQLLFRGPDMSAAAKTGTPAMTNRPPTVPVSVPPAAATASTTEVTVAPVTDSKALATQPDARTAEPPSTGATGNTNSAPASAATPANTAESKPATQAQTNGAPVSANVTSGQTVSAPSTANADTGKTTKKNKKTKTKKATTTTSPAPGAGSSSNNNNNHE